MFAASMVENSSEGPSRLAGHELCRVPDSPPDPQANAHEDCGVGEGARQGAGSWCSAPRRIDCDLLDEMHGVLDRLHL